ncbi:hypothetical protein WJX73_004419 [Symbiochloris irregularis]|uniref:Protein kinase domain-containing protein n=1 Tax=Symbiochloris irregularis TaxID=706552 RepID=A0AAW1PHR0_9CHLO
MLSAEQHSRSNSESPPRKSQWQRVKQAFRGRAAKAALARQEQDAVNSMQPHAASDDELAVSRVHSQAPTWLARARTGSTRNPDVWFKTRLSIPDEVSNAEQDCMQPRPATAEPDSPQRHLRGIHSMPVEGALCDTSREYYSPALEPAHRSRKATLATIMDTSTSLPTAAFASAGREDCIPSAIFAAEPLSPSSTDSRDSMHDSARSVGTGAAIQKSGSISSSNGTISPQLSLSPSSSLKEEEELQPQLPHREVPSDLDSKMPSWLINPYDISFCSMPNGKLCRLGCGAFGTVYRGVFKDRQVAVKVCKHKQVNQRAMSLFRKEVTILHNCRHPNIVSFIGACTWQGGKRTVLVTAYMEKGDVYAALGRNPARYNWHAHGRSIALDVAHGLEFLHSNNIVHFDLKSANILLNRHHRAQIADVGLAKTLTQYHDNRLSTYMATADLGTFAWSAPEVLLGLPCDAKADIYSFGVVLHELATCEVPVGRDLKPIRVPEEGCTGLARLITRCLMQNPADRPTATQLVRYLETMQ